MSSRIRLPRPIGPAWLLLISMVSLSGWSIALGQHGPAATEPPKPATATDAAPAAPPSQPGSAPAATAPSAPPAATRYREGVKLADQLGAFRADGSRWVFEIAGGTRFRVLENLNLERISRLIDTNGPPMAWSVHGVVTEFRGENYLLVSKAIAKSQASTVAQPVAALRSDAAP